VSHRFEQFSYSFVEHGVFTNKTLCSFSKSFAAVRETFSNTYPDEEVPNKTTVHRLTGFIVSELILNRNRPERALSNNKRKRVILLIWIKPAQVGF
jgi:hypothetical protein